jgi:cell wall-associated NlpC family hydrolase
MRDVLLRGVVVELMRRNRHQMSTFSLLAALAALAVAAPLGAQRPAAPVRHTADGALAGGTVAVRGTVSGEDVVRAARKQLGVRYVLGGTTPRAFDCSGLVRYVFAEYGITLPRTAREQAAVGVRPLPGDLKPGDLLFFYGGRGAQHIAMYVGGDTIIHASSTGRRVRYDLLNGSRARPSWFSRRLIAVRRILPAEGTLYLPSATVAGPAGAEPAAQLARSVSALPVLY